MLGTICISFLLLLSFGVPIAAAMMIPTVFPSAIDPSFPGNINYILRAVVAGLDSTPILAVPLFMLSGAVMSKGGISKKLFDVFAFFTGKLTAGMPCAVVITCLFYGAISGSGPATVAAVGAMCIPVLVELGYDKLFAAAIVATAGGLGVIIPPSIPFIMYGVTTGESVGALFIAGILPGILIALSLMIYCYIYCKKNGEDHEKIAKNHKRLKDKGLLAVIKEGFWALLTPVIILGGIYSGAVTPTEAACVSVFYAIFVSVYIYKSVQLIEIIDHMKAAIRSYAPICLLLAFAIAFGRILVLLKAPSIISTFITTTFSNKYTFLFALDIVLLILGMFMDTGSAIAILGPILLKTATAMGVDGIHFGVILVTNLAIGLVSPPIGINLFVAAPLVGASSWELGKKVMPFLGFFLLALLLITYIPAVSLAFLG